MILKRLLAFLVVLSLSLTGCTAATETTPTTAPTTTTTKPAEAQLPDFSDCGEVVGMISHKNLTAYSYFDSEGTVSCRNLLFVPAGTTVSSEKTFALYTYTRQNALDKAMLDATGQTIISEYIVVMAAGTVTLPDDTYLRVSVNGKLDDLIVTYPEDRQSDVTIIDTEYEAYGKDYDRIVAELKTADQGAVNYIFITDIHFDKGAITDAQVSSLIKQVELVTQMANESDAIDFVVVGGDLTSGNKAKSKTMARVNEALAPLKACKKPVLILMGNHDDNTYTVGETKYSDTMAADIVSKKTWNDEVLKVYSPDSIVHDSTDADSAYYYYDVAHKKTRVVCLDAIDYPQRYDENGIISADSLELNSEGNSKSGRSYWGYSVRELQWLIREALVAPDGWNYVFVSHMTVLAENYGTELDNLIKAFQTRTVYQNSEVGTADFTGAQGRIMVYHYGHSHSRAINYSEEKSLWSILTGTANLSQLKNNNPSSENYRGFGSDQECCFDVVSVTTEQVQKYGFGWAEDATMNVQ